MHVPFACRCPLDVLRQCRLGNVNLAHAVRVVPSQSRNSHNGVLLSKISQPFFLQARRARWEIRDLSFSLGVSGAIPTAVLSARNLSEPHGMGETGSAARTGLASPLKLYRNLVR